MKITLQPIDEMFDFPNTDGSTIPCRIWAGKTDKGTEIEAYVLSIVPIDETSDLKNELPEFMRPSREIYATEISDDN